MVQSSTPDYKFIKQQLESGLVIPFLGSAASLVFADQQPCPPSANDLAKQLARNTELPQDEPLELAMVAQYIKGIGGPGPLKIKLHEIFNRDYAVTPLHQYLATVAAQKPLLLVTTNYDDLLELALCQVPHDVVTHICDQPKVFWHKHREQDGKWIDTDPEESFPNELDLDLQSVSTIYKMHGTVDKRKSSRDQYVIADDDYIDFLTRMTKSTAIPSVIAEVFEQRHFLFLGYGLKDWTVRVVLNRIQSDFSGQSSFTSWAIQYQPSRFEYKFWIKRNVEVFDVDLKDFVRNLTVA